MKKLGYLCLVWATTLLTMTSCSTIEESKQIKGSIVFNEIGSHTFNINAESIEATITVIGPNGGEKLIFESVPMYSTVEYTAKIAALGHESKTALFNNLVPMFEASAGELKGSAFNDHGKIIIDWVGFD